MVETIVQIIGMVFVCIIMVCIGWTIVEYITNGFGDNNKLEDNLKKFNKRKNGI